MLDMRTGEKCDWLAQLDSALCDALSFIESLRDISLWSSAGFDIESEWMTSLLDLFANGSDAETPSDVHRLRIALFLVLLKCNSVDFQCCIGPDGQLANLSNVAILNKLLAVWLTSFVLCAVTVHLLVIRYGDISAESYHGELTESAM